LVGDRRSRVGAIALDRGELMAKMQPAHVPRTLPVVLSCEEVSRGAAVALVICRGSQFVAR
jgi:hypothetical protein